MKKLQQLEARNRAYYQALEPLARIDAFVQLVAGNHEKRISDLERHTNI